LYSFLPDLCDELNGNMGPRTRKVLMSGDEGIGSRQVNE
jgi:hypothetical protein